MNDARPQLSGKGNEMRETIFALALADLFRTAALHQSQHLYVSLAYFTCS